MDYQIAICDDCDTDARYVAALVRAWAEECGARVQIEIFPSAEAFMFRYAEKKSFDVLILDIEMGTMDGVKLAREIRRENERIQILFATGYSDYIAEGYEVSALHYLMKPVRREKLFDVLTRAADKMQRNERALHLETSEGMERVPLHEVRFLEVQKNYVTLHARRAHTVKRTLSEFEPLLDERFFRVGRSYIVNLTQVARVTKKEITLVDGSVIPLPRGMYESVNRAIIQRM